MKSIEIKTSFNVIIKFNLATIFDRGLAYFIDMIIVWATIGLITAFLAAIIPAPSDNLFLYAAVPIFGFYTLISEILNNGQTIGKKAMRIQVVRIDGQRTRTSDYFMRWIFRLIDLYFSVYILGILTSTASQRAQRLGDILADTVVVKTKESTATTLSSLIKLNDLKNIAPEYPEVIKLTESEMMVVKECIDRFRQFPNEGHKSAIDHLVERLKDELQVTPKKDKIEFLNTLIRDYVVLTR